MPDPDENSGSGLNAKYQVGASHALYREDGTWYHQLQRFPGALFDKDGYILFRTRSEYESCEYLQLVKDLHVPKGISSIPGYVRFSDAEKAIAIEEVVKRDIAALKSEEELFEGGPKQGFTNYYERKPKVRAAAISIHGTTCMVCQFDFEKYYGSRGAGYIEVHHLKAISSLKEETKIDPRTDLAVVCSNCHRMIHRKMDQVLSLEELRKLIGK